MMWSDSNELARECNRVLTELMTMPEEVREQWVRDVLRWFIGITRQMIQEIQEVQKGGVLSKVGAVKKIKELQAKYGQMIAEKKPQIIVALTYAIKPEYQEELAPFLYAALGLV